MDLIVPKLAFIALNLVGLGLGIWKVCSLTLNESNVFSLYHETFAKSKKKKNRLSVCSLIVWVFFLPMYQIGFHLCLLLRFDDHASSYKFIILLLKIGELQTNFSGTNQKFDIFDLLLPLVLKSFTTGICYCYIAMPK